MMVVNTVSVPCSLLIVRKVIDVRRGLAVYGPSVPGPLMRRTPWGRSRMRVILTEQLEAARRAGASVQMQGRLMAELERYR